MFILVSEYRLAAPRTVVLPLLRGSLASPGATWWRPSCPAEVSPRMELIPRSSSAGGADSCARHGRSVSARRAPGPPLPSLLSVLPCCPESCSSLGPQSPLWSLRRVRSQSCGPPTALAQPPAIPRQSLELSRQIFIPEAKNTHRLPPCAQPRPAWLLHPVPSLEH